MCCSIVPLNVLQVLGGGCQIQWTWRSDYYIKWWLIGRKIMEKLFNWYLKIKLATPENTITYHNTLFRQPKIFHSYCLRFLLGVKMAPMKLLGWQTKGIMVCYGIFWRGQLQSLTRDGCLQKALFKVIWLRKLWCSIWVVAFERWLHMEVQVIYQDSSTWPKWSSVIGFLTAWIINEF